MVSKCLCLKAGTFSLSLTVRRGILQATFADGKQQRSASVCGFSCWVRTRCDVARFLSCPLNSSCFISFHFHRVTDPVDDMSFSIVAGFLMTLVGAVRLGSNYSSVVHADREMVVKGEMCVCVCVDDEALVRSLGVGL